MTKKNKQSQLSQEWIIEALIQLLKTKNYHDITITDITNKAGVARLTFYRNFKDKDDILLTRSYQLFEAYFEELKANNKLVTIPAALHLSFNYWQRDAETLDLLIKNQLFYLIEQPFYSFLEKIIAENSQLNQLNTIQKSFILGGTTQAMRSWITNGSKDSPTEITETLLKIINLATLSDHS
ncbi:TetR/AcrR family transcriptional regulator [Brochothrix thermosphacta]|uniref:TetR/AcrR family transcriptional regulator n=1 Tax=Brochothrix thermosphacta TaxID=2756 RepID=A0A1D2LYV7_BROTH|nr:TetR/AcrR family transcriptional regulator [Brochothrix thermosphacta]ATF26275.1 TetR/AcrR family transcriptional regulator [Brochothrix thermosphacta]ATH85616.1 TetR/AcrR family transcriptional regulator [Brochothrix thermosphacta]MPQ28656.1 TetR/AcrR family transcriptional regulator [Brochothrix thermosphacta]ODJ68462.1 bacterial regulatory s, tetR family protein [Brochothrix thermosphacta]ODJ74403.1 bacterial regulatory s, tetR family protein [Brochothrix thermosphacta]